MMAGSTASSDGVERLGTKLVLTWAGLSIGVAFLATPVKFLAPSLTLPVALDVCRHTFQVYNGTELVLLAAMLILGAGSGHRRRWYLALLGPAAAVLAQAFWLIPALDVRTTAILAGRAAPPSTLHTTYIAVEGLKVLWLLAVGFSELLFAPPRHTAGLDRRCSRKGAIKWPRSA
jgi:hypothetical protein